MRINYLSDFKVRLQPTVGGEPVDITGHDFRIVFGTSGGTRRYECGKSGDTLTNCTIDGTAIVCVLDNHHLSKGQLCAWVFDYAPDDTYPDGNELTVTPSEIDVTLVRGAGDGSDIEAEVAADISAAVHTAQEAAAAAAASADDADDAAVLARAAQVAAEDAAERAAEVGGYSKSEADALLALKADKATTYTKTETNSLLNAKADTADLAVVATSGSYNDLLDKPSVAPQEQADWAQSDSTAVDFIKHKPNVYTKTEVDNICPIIEDTRSTAVAAITGVAPFATLEDGQRILLKTNYITAGNTTLQLTLSDNTTTQEIPVYYQINASIIRVGSNTFIAGGYYELVYEATNMRWVSCGHDYNTTYTVISQQEVDAGTSTANRIVNAKVLRDNFYTESEVDTAVAAKADKVAVIDASTTDEPAAITQAIAPNTFYDFGVVDSLTITLTAGESGYLAIYACSFTAASDSTTLTLPATVTGEAPTITAGHRYELNIMDNVLLYTENGND